MWQKCTDAGSPPCSPQMPSLRSGRGLAAALGRDLDQLADALDVERREGVLLEDAALLVRRRRNVAGVVAARAERRLREVVGAEGEEVGVLGDRRRPQRGARQLDHGADEVVELLARHLADFRRDLVDHRLRSARAPSPWPTSGIMISGITVLPCFFCTSRGRLEDRAGLHLVDLGIGDAEPAAAMAEHRVELVQLVRRAAAIVLDVDAEIACADLGDLGRRRAAGTRAAADRAGGW